MHRTNRIIVGLGSNQDKERNMERAVALLQAYFESICYSDAVYTVPVGGSYGGALFLNRVAVAYSPLSPTELNILFKRIEQAVGRRPEDKAQGRIAIDIDLVQWNDDVLKPDDLSREYVADALSVLKNK